MLEQVGLRDRATDRVGTYSLGMKQRLAVAAALLKQPRVLILDEPASGLDPGGIREMRDLLRSLAGSGTTILLSSHLLGEIRHLCDTVTIISRGRRVTAGPVGQVLARHAGTGLRIRFENGDELGLALKALIAVGIDVTPGTDQLILANVRQPAAVSRTLAEHGLFVAELVLIALAAWDLRRRDIT